MKELLEPILTLHQALVKLAAASFQFRCLGYRLFF